MTDTTNVTPLSVLAERIRSAHAKAERGRQELIKGKLELAAALKEAQAMSPDNCDSVAKE